MASETDICNLALSHLGDEATVVSINPPEGSAQADHCARWYPIALEALLEMHPWSFATKRAAGAPLASPATTWAYAYAFPSSAIQIISVLPYGAVSDSGNGSTYSPQPFVVETLASGAKAVLSNAEQATLRYTVRVSDTAQFPPLFVQALTRLLASYLAGPVLKGETGRAESAAQLKGFGAWFSRAASSDASQQHMDRTGLQSVSWINDR